MRNKQTTIKPLPKLPENAKPWTILKKVCEVIEDEPKRYHQHSVIEHGEPREFFPACGTVACVAGWVCLLTRKREPQEQNVLGIAQRILSLDDDEAHELFSGNAAGPERKDYCPWGEVTAKTHAKLGIAHIRKFVKKKWNKTI